MSETLQTVGSAIGIVSLGIQVCQGLVTYFRLVDHKEKEIATGLKEIQAVVSIFHSLNETLPLIEKRAPVDSIVIRQCLQDCKEGLLELQGFLVDLRGPDSECSPDTRESLKKTGSSLIYPLREGKLKLLHKTARGLLDNLNLAVHISSLKFDLAHQDVIHAVEESIENVQAGLHFQNEIMNDLHIRVQHNSIQLQILQRSVSETLYDIEGRLARTEWRIKELHGDINGSLRLIQSDIRTVALGSQVTSEIVAGLVKKMEAQSKQISGMSFQISQLHKKDQERHTSTRRQLATKSPLNRSLLQHSSIIIPPTDTYPTKKVIPKTSTRSPRCDCLTESHSATYWYACAGFAFRFKQKTPISHHRNCKLQNVSQKTEWTMQAQVQLKLGYFLDRIAQLSLSYTAGSGDLGLSIQYNNVVPRRQSPVFDEMNKMKTWIKFRSRSSEDIVRRLKSCENAILSMYRDGKASPSDRDEYGESHVTYFIQRMMPYIGIFSHICSDSAVMSVVLGILRTLLQVVQPTDEKIALSDLIRYLHKFLGDTSREEWINGQSLITCLAGTFEVDFVDIVRQALCEDIIPVIGHLRDVLSDFELSPITRAILSRSLEDLDEIISNDPCAPLERVFGLTTLQLCSTWPQGLSRLLKTQARSLVDVGDSHEIRRNKYLQPIQLAVRLNFTRSVDLLLKAGCDVSFNCDTAKLFAWASHECVNVIAANLAERRRNLLQLAQQKLGLMKHKSPYHVADGEAVFLCKALDSAGVHIPRHLRVPPGYKTIYLFPGISAHHFPAFFENGFRDIDSHNPIGLTAIMISRGTYRLRYSSNPKQKYSIALWTINHGMVDIKAKDPWSIGLNTTTAGWNYVSSMYGSGRIQYSDTKDTQPLFMCNLMKELAAPGYRDGCVCWCNPQGKGCSAFKSMWKAHVDEGPGGGIMSQERSKKRREQLVRHIVFHGTINPTGVKSDKVLEHSLDLIRFLTFEALDMTHTCCSLKGIDEENRCLASREDYRPGMTFAVASCNAEKAERIRSDKTEQENSRLLEALMDEFRYEMTGGDATSAKGLEMFVWGYWRRRISELFTVQPFLVEDMRQTASQVRTHVLPERVSYFLGSDFDIIKPMKDDIKQQHDNSMHYMDNSRALHHCPFCDVQGIRRDMDES
ncbi:hypothetical protein F4810DRAFT_661989 [Camillea tinctor]|nr:hypothetical protein F4810DRAFT_661989 [Camillea tinctor]